MIAARRFGYGALGLVLGLLVAAIGSTVYGSQLRFLGVTAFPLGLILALAACLAVAVYIRSTGQWWGYAGTLVGVLVAALVLAGKGPGGSLLVPAGNWQSYAWVYGSTPLAALSAALPPSLFRDKPVRTRRRSLAIPGEK